MAKLTIVICAPRVNYTRSCQEISRTAERELEVQNVKLLNTFDAMRSVKLAKDTSAPDKHLVVHRQRRRELPSSHPDNPRKRELLKENGDRRALGWWTGSELAVSIGAHHVNLTLLRQGYRMRGTTFDLINFLWNLVYINWSGFICEESQAELPMLTSTTGEESPNVIDEG